RAAFDGTTSRPPRTTSRDRFTSVPNLFALKTPRMKRESLRSPIPKEIRDQLSKDIWRKECKIYDGKCDGRIQWHHAFTYAGKRINEMWSIIPLCKYHHDYVSRYTERITNLLWFRINKFNAL